MTVNKRVKELRIALGLSQVKFAGAIAISKGYIAGIELGNRRVNDRLILLISKVFHVSEQWLKTGEGEMFEETGQLERKFEKLTPGQQQDILQQIDRLLAGDNI